jgi:group I intron endonuclease
MQLSGIYCILCVANNKKYIGSSCHIERRWGTHKAQLRNNKHRNIHLQNAWNKYGENQFEFSIVEFIPIELLLDAEQKYLDDVKVNQISYFNINIEAEAARRGAKHSEATKAKMSLAKQLKRKPLTDKTKQKISQVKLNKTIYSFVNDCTGETYTGICHDFKIKYALGPAGVSSLINNKQRYHKCWRLQNNT